MVQKDSKENVNKLLDDHLVKGELNLNNEPIPFISQAYQKLPSEYRDKDLINNDSNYSNYSNYLQVNDSADDIFNYSDNASHGSDGNCSSNSSTTGNLIRTVNLDDVEFELVQEANKSNLTIKVKLSKLKIKQPKKNVFETKAIYIDFEDTTNTLYQLRIKPLYDSIIEITSVKLIDKDCFEIVCKKDLPIEWPSVLQKKRLLSNYMMEKFSETGKSFSNEPDYEPNNEFNNVADENCNPISFAERLDKEEDRDEECENYPKDGWKKRFNYRRTESVRRRNNLDLIPYNNTNEIRIQIGYTGLDNLGNTCFMNTVLQCLSNTDELRDFFLNNNFNANINRNNPFGSSGHVAIGFYNIVSQLWSGKHSSYSPEKFKEYISSKMNKFEGNAQEDSVEFMEIFLDLLHEDLNRVDRTKKIIVDPLPKEEDKMTDNELADAMWKRHLKFNDSLIVDFFHGQLKSHLTCSVCAKNSLTFDPFLFLPVPLPKPQITLTVFYFSLDYEKKPLKVSVTCSQDVKCLTLLNQISEKFDVNINDLRLMVCNSESEKLVDNDVQIYQFGDNCQFFIFRIKNETECKEKVFNFIIKQYRICTSKSYLEMNDTKEMSYWSLNDWIPDKQPLNNHLNSYALGRPFIISLSKSELNYKNLSTALKNRSRHSVDINLFKIEKSNVDKVPSNTMKQLNLQQEFNREESNNDSSLEEEMNDSRIEINLKPVMNGKKELRCRVVKVEGEMNTDCYFNILEMKNDDIYRTIKLNEETDFESYAQTISTSFTNLLMQWKDDEASDYRIRVNCKDLDHSATFYELLNQINEKNITTLEDCLRMFTDKEELSLDDYWHCPKCEKPQKASKQLTIWRLPKILIIQLKRFSYKQFTRDKIDNFIDFPLYNLDLKNFCSESNQPNLEGKTLYDLYGVINHYGGIYGGHYTATAKTIFKDKEYGWRVFDDYNVDNIDESLIVSNNAYILFYRLKNQSNMETE